MNFAENHINQSKLEFAEKVGTANVNVFTGRILFERQDISIGLNEFNISISHIFDSQPVDNSDYYMGAGWRLNIQQYVRKSYVKDNKGEYLYIYVDANGYMHEFEKYDNQNGEALYFDRTGLNLTLYVTNNGNCYIKDAHGGKWEFNKGYTTKKLTCIVSAINGGLKQQIEYDGYERPVRIFNSKFPNRIINLFYNDEDDDNKLLQRIENPAAQVKINYEYDNKGNLISVKEFSERTERYSVIYSYVNNLLRYAVAVIDNSSLKISYDKFGRVVVVNCGQMATDFHYSEPYDTLFAGYQASCGADLYCGQKDRKLVG